MSARPAAITTAARLSLKRRRPPDLRLPAWGARIVSDMFTIAIDAMGGDRAPGMVVKGADIALERHPNARFLIFGAEGQVAPLLAKLPRLAKTAELHHTDE